MGTRGEQLTDPRLAPALTAAQQRALEYAEALERVDDAKESAERRKEAMLTAANDARLASVKVTDAAGVTHTFDVDWKLHIKHTARREIERVVAGQDAEAIAGT